MCLYETGAVLGWRRWRLTVLLFFSSSSSSADERTVSGVGTMMSANFVSGSTTYRGMPCIHVSH